jgi:hypothetical protein
MLSAYLTTVAFPACAQEPGKYTGSYINNQGNTTSLALDITSVEGGKIEGTGLRQGYTQTGVPTLACSGEFPLTGTLKGTELDVRAAKKFGRAQDCSFRLRGTMSGKKIQGKVAGAEVELTR